MKRLVQLIVLFAIGLWCSSVLANPFESERRLTIDVSVSAGGLVAVGVPNFKGNFSGGIDFRLTWRIKRRLHLGVRLGLFLSQVPYGQDGNRTSFGEIVGNPPGPFSKSVTVFPFATSVLVYHAHRVVELSALLGVGFIASSKQSRGGAYPRPAIGLGVSFSIAKAIGFDARLRIECDYLPLDYSFKQALLLPQLNIVFRF